MFMFMIGKAKNKQWTRQLKLGLSSLNVSHRTQRQTYFISIYLVITIIILFQKKPLQSPSFLKSNIVGIQDTCIIWNMHTCNFISETDLIRKLHNSSNWISEWTKLKSSIPSKFIDIIKNRHEDSSLARKSNMSRRNLNFITKAGFCINPQNLQLREINN